MEGATITRREHFEGLAKQGVEVPELQGPQLPEELKYLYEWFIELWSGQMITWTELKAWGEIKGVLPAPWEADLLRKMARIWM